MNWEFATDRYNRGPSRSRGAPRGRRLYRAGHRSLDPAPPKAAPFGSPISFNLLQRLIARTSSSTPTTATIFKVLRLDCNAYIITIRVD